MLISYYVLDNWSKVSEIDKYNWGGGGEFSKVWLHINDFVHLYLKYLSKKIKSEQF